MPTWGVGDDHDSDEVRTLKEQLRVKDAAHATLHGEYLKRESELKEVQNSFNEVLVKLRKDADRIVQLEAEVQRRNEELSNERLTRANSEVALTTAERRLKESEQNILELQSIVDTISDHADSTSQGRSKLEKDNAALQTRVRALERELQIKEQAEETALRQSQGLSANARHRRQLSQSPSRTPALEKELAELRAASEQQGSSLQRVTEQLVRTRDELVRLQNEKTACERHLQNELADTRAALEDREEDLRLLRTSGSGEDVAAREADLLERLEVEENRIVALESELARSTGSKKRDLVMLQDELARTTELLDEANKKVVEAEVKLSQFARDREAALHDRQQLAQEHDRLSKYVQATEDKVNELQHQLSASGGASPTVVYQKYSDEETTAHIERLLIAVQRLRAERDDLRRQLEFVQVEKRFEVEALQAKAAAAASLPTTPAYTDTEFTTLSGYVGAVQEQADRHSRAAIALALVTQNVEQRAADAESRIQSLSEQLSATRQHLQRSEERLASTSGAISDTEAQVVGLRHTIQRLEDELAKERASHAETCASLSDVETRLNSLSEALTDAEAARDALALEKMHLESDLEIVRRDLADAEAQHSEQVATLSAAGQSGQGQHAALRAHIQTLEERVARRTEQIGIHQHDIKRLELNMKLQEERLAELTQELEVVQNEKVAMLEDCRTTREERDEAMRRCDELEEAMEGVEEFRERELEAMVHVTFQAMAAKRDTTVHWHVSASEHARLQEQIHVLEAEKAALSVQVANLTAERDHLAEATQQELDASHARYKDVVEKLQTVEEAKAAAESQLSILRIEQEARSRELTSLQNQLSAARASNEDRQSMEASHFAQEKAELEARLQQTQASHATLETAHHEAIAQLKRVEEELRHAEDELATHLANSAVQSEAEDRLREEIAQVRRQHTEEAAALQEQLKNISDELEAMTRLRGEADASRKAVEEELARTKQDLETRFAESVETLDTASRLEAELEQLKATHAEETRNFDEQLDAVTSELQEVTRRKHELEALHEQALHQCEERAAEVDQVRGEVLALETQLAQLRATHAQELGDLQQRLDDATRDLQEAKASASAEQRNAVDELERNVEELKYRLTVATREADEYRAELEEEKAAHVRTRESTTAELREIVAMRDEAEQALAEAENELPNLRAQLQHAESTLRGVEEEKLSLQYQTTNLEAEVQRAKSLQRFLESQVADGETRVSSLEKELADLTARYTHLDKLAQASDANLAMQKIQHEQTIASLRREINALRAQPSSEEEIADLKEKNAEYEELLRAKCLEIEENDDKFIDMLKEKKKLNSKIESLSRKVQTLQSKLDAAVKASEAAASAPTSAPPPKPPAVFSPMLAAAPNITNSASTSRTLSRQRVVTAPAPDTVPFSQPPPMPIFRPKTPESSRNRMMSGPSSISHPKTPESRSTALPVFKARTPERHRVPTTSSMPESSSSSSSLIGVKRRAPDDFEDCAAMPPQMFSADSAPLGYSADEQLPAQPTTPRLRKALQSMRTGFTPVRHTSSRAGSASPRRATTGAAMSAPLSMDVTNNPARPEPAKAAAAKKGWLGKIKSGPSQSRAFSSRQPVFDPPGQR